MYKLINDSKILKVLNSENKEEDNLLENTLFKNSIDILLPFYNKNYLINDYNSVLQAISFLEPEILTNEIFSLLFLEENTEIINDFCKTNYCWGLKNKYEEFIKTIQKKYSKKI